MARQQMKPYPLRLPSDLSEWLKKRAKMECRSLNAELIKIVRDVKEEEDKAKQAA